MGLSLPLIAALTGIVDSYSIKGSILALGVQSIRCTGSEASKTMGLMRPGRIHKLSPITNHREIYSALGFLSSTSIDLYPDESPDRIVDLSKPLPADFGAAFDAYLDAGTLEHVFDLKVALAGLIECLRPGGVAIHISPLSGFENHGFYQFSPKLFARLYASNGFQELQAWIIGLGTDDNQGVVIPLMDHDAPLSIDPTYHRTLLLYSARLSEKTPLVVPVDSHLQEFTTPSNLVYAPTRQFLDGLDRADYTPNIKT